MPIKIKFETLVDDVQNLLNGHDLTKSVQEFSDKLGVDIAARFTAHGLDRKPTLRMSNIGRPMRQLWYEMNGVKGTPLPPEAKFKFLYGDILESLFLYLSKEAGHDVQSEQKEIKYEDITGHIDAVIDGVLVDIKSCSTHSWEKFNSGTLLTDDPFGYIAQLTGYKNALDIQRAAFIAIDKVTGRICTFELPGDGQELDLKSRIRDVRAAMGSDVEPDRCYPDKPVSKKDVSGNMVLGIGCSYCAFKEHCWRDSNEGQGLQLRHYSTGPKWFTKIAKEPRLKYKEQEEDDTNFPTKDSQ